LEEETKAALLAINPHHTLTWVEGVRYNTNINPEGGYQKLGFGGGELCPKRIDHIVCGGGGETLVARLLLPKEILFGLQACVNVLIVPAKKVVVVLHQSIPIVRTTLRRTKNPNQKPKRLQSRPPKLPALGRPIQRKL